MEPITEKELKRIAKIILKAKLKRPSVLRKRKLDKENRRKNRRK